MNTIFDRINDLYVKALAWWRRGGPKAYFKELCAALRLLSKVDFQAEFCAMLDRAAARLMGECERHEGVDMASGLDMTGYTTVTCTQSPEDATRELARLQPVRTWLRSTLKSARLTLINFFSVLRVSIRAFWRRKFGKRKGLPVVKLAGPFLPKNRRPGRRLNRTEKRKGQRTHDGRMSADAWAARPASAYRPGPKAKRKQSKNSRRVNRRK